MRRSRRGKRNRERKTRRIVVRSEWWLCGRKVVTVEVRDRGEVWVTVRGGPRRVHPEDRERAADYLREFLPRLTHDERYAILWG